MKRALGSAVFAATLMISGTAFGAEVAPDKVMFKDGAVMDSITGAAGDAAAGRKAFANRKLGNCLACHQNPDMPEQLFHGETGPSLEGVNERYSVAELRGILVDSKVALSEETLMPGFYSLKVGVRPLKKFAGKTVLTAQQVEDILAYVQTLK